MKNIGFKILYIVTAIVIFVELGFAVKGGLFTDIEKLPKGELSYTQVSGLYEKLGIEFPLKNTEECSKETIEKLYELL